MPGDAIAGLVTRGRGVSVHRRNCPNLAQFKSASGRLLQASWEEQVDRSYQVSIEVQAHDRTNLLADVIAALSENGVQIYAVDGRADSDQTAVIHLTIGVRDRLQLEQIMNRIKRVKDIYSVRRHVYGKN